MPARPGPAVVTEDVMVEGRDGPIPARVYTRSGTKPGAPAILFIHGGAFIDCGGTSATTCSAAWLTVPATWSWDCPTGSPPEHPPAGLHDCADVLQWMHDRRPGALTRSGSQFGGREQWGNLAVALFLYVRDHGGPAIAHQSVYYPFTDASLAFGQLGQRPHAGRERQAGQLMARLYVGGEAADPLVNMLGADLAGLPPATVITCGHDVLHHDGLRLTEALRAAGVETRHTHYDDMPHGFLMFSRLTTRVAESMDEMPREVAKRLGAVES